MTFCKTILAVVLTAALVSCNDSRSVRDQVQDPSAYTPAAISGLAATDYDAAMALVEEGMLKGQLSVYDSYVQRARLTYQYTENDREAAAWMCKALEQEESRNPDVRMELLYHYSTILLSAQEYTECLSACAEGKEIAHGIGHAFEGFSFDFLVGKCLFAIGEDEDGISLMRDAIAGATSIADTREDYGHLVFFTSNLVNCLIELKDYPAALEECARNEAYLTRMENTFPDTSPAYLDRSRFYLDLNRAICDAGEGRKSLSALQLERALSREYASTKGGKCRLADYYAVAGEPERILEIYSNVPYEEADTVTRGYRLRLARLRDAYAHAGMDEEAARLGAQYDTISALLEKKETAEGIRVNAAKYDTQQYRLALGDSLSVLKKYRIGIVIVLILIALALVSFLLLNRGMSRRMDEKHKKETASLEKDLRSLQKQVALIAERELTGAPEGEVNHKDASFQELIEGKQLYLNKNLNRESAASLLGLSQAEISRALSEITPGLSFPDYIKGLRIRHALQLLGENPDMPIAELSDKCGFYTTRTLQRSFLAITGKTPSEYARSLKSQGSAS